MSHKNKFKVYIVAFFSLVVFAVACVALWHILDYLILQKNYALRNDNTHAAYVALFVIIGLVIFPASLLLRLIPFTIELTDGFLKIKTIIGYRTLQTSKLRRISRRKNNLTEENSYLFFHIRYGLIYLYGGDFKNIDALCNKIS